MEVQFVVLHLNHRNINRLKYKALSREIGRDQQFHRCTKGTLKKQNCNFFTSTLYQPLVSLRQWYTHRTKRRTREYSRLKCSTLFTATFDIYLCHPFSTRQSDGKANRDPSYWVPVGVPTSGMRASLYWAQASLFIRDHQLRCHISKRDVSLCSHSTLYFEQILSWTDCCFVIIYDYTCASTKVVRWSSSSPTSQPGSCFRSGRVAAS